MNRAIQLTVGCVAVVLATAGQVQAAPINLLTNPGFETGSFSGWTIGGNSLASGVATDGTNIPGISVFFTPTFQNVRSGDFAGNALVRNGAFSTGIELITLTQSVNVLAGESYTLSFFMGADAANSGYGVSVIGNSNLQIIVDGTGLLPDQFFVMDTGSAPGDFIPVSAIYNSTTTQSIDVTFQITGSGNGAAGFSFDDFQVFGEEATVIPEPSSLALLAMGALGLIGYRRRKRKQAA